MRRREFLRRAALVGAASAAVTVPAITAPEAYHDSFDRHGWRVQWSGWARPVNQRIVVGHWSAHRIGDTSGDFTYCTTLGVCTTAHRFYTLDLAHTREWPALDCTHTAREAELVKRAALTRLLEHLA